MSIEDLKAEQILKEIEPWINKDVTVFDAVIHYTEKYDIEIEVMGEIVKRSPILKAKIREDAEKRNMVEKIKRLPL